MVVLKGTYYDGQGSAQVVDLQYKATYVNKGKLTWTMWPNIVFDSQTGSKLGSFVGSIAVINMGNDQSSLYSDRLPVKVIVKPSIIVRVARPVNSDCSSLVSKTTDKTGFAFTAEVVGLRPGTKDSPLTFMWTFMADQWKVAWNYNTMNPDSVMPKTGAFVIEDRIVSGKTSVVSDGGNRNFLLKVGSDLLGTASLKELKTAEIKGVADSFDANVNVVAIDASNKTARVTIPINIARLARLHYDGNQYVVERYAPTMVSDCIPGGDIGRQVTYSEDKSETRGRSMSFSYNASLAVNISPIPSNPFALGINFSAGFGVDVNSSLSSSKSKGMNLSGQILPGEYGMFYRQTTMVQRVGTIMIRNKCGAEVSPGKAFLSDWIWTPDLATGSTCPPPTLLPPPQKFR